MTVFAPQAAKAVRRTEMARAVSRHEDGVIKVSEQ